MVEAFAYEDIYELLRTEKFATDLEKIGINDLARIKSYLDSKAQLLKQEGEATNILSSHKKAKIQMEIDNALRALKDLYEIRERKIINRALVSTRTEAGLKDTTNMLDIEAEVYEQLLSVLKKSKEDFFNLLENIPVETERTEKSGEVLEEANDEESTETEEEGKPIELHKVRFLQACPEVFGEDLQKYGPFKTDDEAELPEQLCSILENQKKVERKTL